MTNLFLGFALFFPRLTLLFCWFTDAIPPNSTPFFVDFMLAWLAPRFLIAYWLYEAGGHPLLVLLFILFGLSEIGSTSRTASANRSNKQ